MYFRKEEEENFALELTPLIDVVFLLLIFFMVSTAFVDFPRRMDIVLPTSISAASSVPDTHLEIEMTVDKLIFLDGNKVTRKQLQIKLNALKNPSREKALIRADRYLPYGEVIEVMGLLQRARVVDISVAVK
ncbi:MAG: ExbD/TolR family protein [Nitrospinaceae bacterium]